VPCVATYVVVVGTSSISHVSVSVHIGTLMRCVAADVVVTSPISCASMRVGILVLHVIATAATTIYKFKALLGKRISKGSPVDNRVIALLRLEMDE